LYNDFGVGKINFPLLSLFAGRVCQGNRAQLCSEHRSIVDDKRRRATNLFLSTQSTKHESRSKMPSGPALNFNGSYPDRVKLLHTMTPAYSMFWRRHPSPAQQVAVQQLNQQGLYPAKNNRADFSNGQYPATIKLAATGAPGCQGWYENRASCRCNGCCPGQTPTPMAAIVARPSCTQCAGADSFSQAMQAPGTATYAQYGGMPTVNRQQAIAMGQRIPDAYAFGRYGGRASCTGCAAGQWRGGY